MQNKPDTDIPCQQCNGTGRRLTHECGACFGFGLSTAPWDQRRNGTTIAVWGDEPRNMDGIAVHAFKHTECRGVGGVKREGYILLVSWKNPHYRGNDKGEPVDHA